MEAIQRNLLYANAINTLWWPWSDINKPELWGFAKNQVTPFHLKTSDGETLYAWHIMPLPLYTAHEEKMAAQPGGLCRDITQTENFKLLREDPDSRLVIYLHGNAGHIAQAIRPHSYHALTDTSSYHVLSIDYRGFGHSTGHPTEEGLIRDGSAAVDWATHVAGVPAKRIVLLGQSLGTAVASAVAHRYLVDKASEATDMDFAGVVLVAAFSSLPTMLAQYRMGGLVPPLAPLRMWPWLLQRVLDSLVDTWKSADRWTEVVRTVKGRGGRLRLSLVHAQDDWDIPCTEDDKIFAAAVNGTVGPEGDLLHVDHLKAEKDKRTVVKGENAFVATWMDGDVLIRQELAPYGGHNDIMSYAPVAQAVMRSFDLVGTGKARS